MAERTAIVYLAFGSNLGDRLGNLAAGVEVIIAADDIQLAGVSSVYETPPWGKTDQPAFLNACAAVHTALSPRQMLARCMAAEQRLGRVRLERWGPRTLDVDIICYGDEVVVEEPDLLIPHPHLSERAFVLIPLLELAPDLLLPGGHPVAAMLPHVAQPGIARRVSASAFAALIQQRLNGLDQDPEI